MSACTCGSCNARRRVEPSAPPPIAPSVPSAVEVLDKLKIRLFKWTETSPDFGYHRRKFALMIDEALARLGGKAQS